MKIKAPLPYFGGKRTLAPTIVEELGPHTSYFEPFCGSAAVLFAKRQTKNETINDLHGDATNLLLVLADLSLAHRLYSRLQQYIVYDALLERAEAECAKPWDGDKDLVRAEHYFVLSWMARNGLAGTSETNYQLAVRWTASGGSPSVRFQSAVDSIPDWHRRLKNVVVLCRDAFKIIPKFEDAEHVAIYVDPPYPAETRMSANKVNSGKGHSGQYLHDFSIGTDDLYGGQDDHARLAAILAEFRHSRIVVSSYRCARYEELYDGWRIRECRMNKQLAQQNQRGKSGTTEAKEVLFINGPPS